MSFQLSRRRFLGRAPSSRPQSLAVRSYHPAPSAQAASLDVPYGPASGVAKLNANENPYGPSREARRR